MQAGTRQEQLRSKREHWRAHSKAWSQSGKTQAAYCEQHSLNLKTFAYWRRRLKTESTTVRLVQLPTGTQQQPEGSPVRVVVDDRYRIEVTDDFSPATLGRILEVFRGL